MRVDERHQRKEAVVGDAEDAHLPVALGRVLHQPVDGVPGIGGMIDRGRVLRSVQRAIHHVVALGAVLAADVLDDADVAALDDHLGGVVVAVQDGAKVGALRMGRELVGAVRRAGQKDGRAVGAPRDENDGVQLDPVAHWNHRLAPDVIEPARGGAEGIRRLARQGGRRLSGRRRSERQSADQAQERGSASGHHHRGSRGMGGPTAT